MGKNKVATKEKSTYWRTAISNNHPLPDGIEESSYLNYQKWSREKWAWEFLRRSRKFQAACDDLASQKNLIPKDRAIAELNIAREYGLKKFKNWHEGYGKNSQRPRFVSPHMKVNLNHEALENFSVTMLSGQALVLFDLESALNDEQFLTIQIDKTKKFLMASLKKYQNISGKHKSSIRPNIPEEKILLKYLRMLDLVRSRKKRHWEIFSELYPDEIKDENGNRYENEELKDKLKSILRTPNSYVNKKGYLRIGAAPSAEKKV